jgi:hypothetical protein
MTFRVQKFQTLAELELFLNGAIFGGDVTRGIAGLVGLPLTFAQPAATVTFVRSAGPDPDVLLFKDLKAQIEGAAAALLVTSLDGRLAIVEKVPAAGVALAAPAQAAKALLGFDATGATRGRVHRPLGVAGAPPFVTQAYAAAATVHVVHIWE